MTDKVTYWTKSGYDPEDIYADKAFSAPVVIACEYMTGGSMQRDNDSVEFTPTSSIYSIVSLPFGAYVLFGEHTDLEPPSNAEIVRKTGTGTPLLGQLTEYEAFTG